MWFLILFFNVCMHFGHTFLAYSLHHLASDSNFCAWSDFTTCHHIVHTEFRSHFVSGHLIKHAQIPSIPGMKIWMKKHASVVCNTSKHLLAPNSVVGPQFCWPPILFVGPQFCWRIICRWPPILLLFLWTNNPLWPPTILFVLWPPILLAGFTIGLLLLNNVVCCLFGRNFWATTKLKTPDDKFVNKLNFWFAT